MLYRILRTLHAWYPLGVLWIYVLAFLVALGMMFVFPQITLLLFFLGLGGLGLAVIGARALGSLEHAMAKRIVGRGTCPRCGRSGQHRADGHSDWSCESCGAIFGPRGEELAPIENRVPRQP